MSDRSEYVANVALASVARTPADVTLVNGRTFTHAPQPNGSHDVVSTDGNDAMSMAEWEEYCAVICQRSRLAIFKARAARGLSKAAA